MSKQSAGLLLFRRMSVGPGRLEVLLVHPGGPFWARKDDGAWSIPKGEFSDGEDPLTAARREFREETGVETSGEFVALEPIRQAGGKRVLAWALESDFDPSALNSNMFSMEWPPKSGQQQQFPEVDRAAWFAIDVAKRKILTGQAPFLDQLLLEVQDAPGNARRAKALCAREQRFVFDEVPELYSRARPTYPVQLIEDIIRESRLGTGARILEIGSGPGNASVLFSGRGYHLLCLEPGQRLADAARRQLAADTNAQVVVTTFEDWPVEPGAFDLVFAAQSFHWIDPAVRFSKAALALKPGGTLAVFANRPLRGTRPVDTLIQQAYAEHAPEIPLRWSGHDTRNHFLELFADATDFATAQCREYGWQRDYSSAEYADLLRTHSDHRLLDAERLSRLLDAITRAIDGNGGRLVVDYVAVLCWARRISTTSAG